MNGCLGQGSLKQMGDAIQKSLFSQISILLTGQPKKQRQTRAIVLCQLENLRLGIGREGILSMVLALDTISQGCMLTSTRNYTLPEVSAYRIMIL